LHGAFYQHLQTNMIVNDASLMIIDGVIHRTLLIVKIVNSIKSKQTVEAASTGPYQAAYCTHFCWYGKKKQLGMLNCTFLSIRNE